mgnify:CR=1 FL=1|tara:strand:- start:446 stop:1591 length:1146 start_codon:yes stop_codon:yes gene_type:complete
MKRPLKQPKVDAAGDQIIQVPLYIAATSPLTLVTFDEGDEPSFTLEQINKQTYDRLKLCRTTTSLDPMLSAMDRMAVIVSYTGALLFPRMPGVSEEEVLASANRLLLKLTFGGIPFNAMNSDDVGFGFIYGTGYFLAASGAGGPNFNTLVALQHQDAGSFDTMRLLHPRVRTSSEIHAAVRTGTPVVEGIPEMNPSLFLNGLTYFRKGELAPSLVFLWSTCESLIGRLWDDHVLSKGSGIPSRKSFVEGNAWQAAHKVEVLFQMSLIETALYTQLNHARKARNALAHRGTIPKVGDCKAALQSAFQLVSAVRSGGEVHSEFKQLADMLASVHDPHTGPLNPKYWREIPSVPGDEKWEGEYPRHAEIELVPISDIARKSGGR